MKKLVIAAAVAIALGACGKKPEVTTDAANAQPSPTAATSSAASTEQQTEEQEAAARELAQKQEQLDYATMEDGYLNDTNAQWASSAKASSTFGDTTPDQEEVNRLTGKADGTDWTNNNQDMGFDWIQVEFANAVNATEVRFVFPEGKGVEAVSKVELIDDKGESHIIWSGISDVKRDDRGNRTWFVRKFEPTAYKVKGTKLTIANNLYNNYKYIDAVQLVGK
jgi:hypothetical protein